jgi:outer membrane protein assembly factor BamA
MSVFRIILIITFLPVFAFADTGDSTRTKKVKIFPLPAFGYAPETRWYIGAVGLFNIRFTDDTLVKPSTFEAEFNYTQNKQVIITADFEMRFPKRNYLLLGENGYFKFPENYWGIGADTKDEDETRIDANRIEIDNSLLKKQYFDVYTGLRFRYHRMDITDSGDPDFFFFHPDRYEATGGGLVFLHDSRDNPLNATTGIRAYFSATYFYNATPQQGNFYRFDTDLRWYHAISKNHVLAFHLNSGNTSGDVPVRMLPLLGNENIMRGYYEGRYRDQHLTAIQGEYRMKIWNWIGAVAFAGCGTVYDENAKLKSISLLPNYGTGLRIRLDKKDNINLRFDYGMGKNAEGFYVSFGEAF